MLNNGNEFETFSTNELEQDLIGDSERQTQVDCMSTSQLLRINDKMGALICIRFMTVHRIYASEVIYRKHAYTNTKILACRSGMKVLTLPAEQPVKTCQGFVTTTYDSSKRKRRGVLIWLSIVQIQIELERGETLLMRDRNIKTTRLKKI